MAVPEPGHKERVLPMPKPKRTAAELPSPELVLAAIERAQLHHDRPSVPVGSIKAHLGLPHNGWTTRQLRPTWDSLEMPLRETAPP
jgi:hypothetical protein